MATDTLKFSNEPSLIKLTEGTIQVSSDNGNTWDTVIDGAGVKSATLNGSLDINNLKIYDKKNPTFIWNKDGLNAYTHKDGSTNFTKFVRFDQYGIYGVSNYIAEGDVEESYFVPGCVGDIERTADFGFIWGEFFLKSNHDGGMVKISSDEDIQVFANDSERIKIGKLDDAHYGIRLKNDLDETVMQTTDDGNLELSGKITAKSGLIGGFDISEDKLISTEENKEVIVSPAGIGLGTTTDGEIDSKEFRITPDGQLYATNAVIAGTLKTSVFEKDTTRVEGGTSVYKNAANIDILRSYDNILYFTNDEGYEDFSVGNVVAVFKSGLDGSPDDDSEDSEGESTVEVGNSGTDEYYVIIEKDDENKFIKLDRIISVFNKQEPEEETEGESGEEIYIPSVDKSYLLIYIQADESINNKDWIIGVNSTDKEKPLNLHPNSITFSEPTLDTEKHSISYEDKVIIGDLSSLRLEDTENGLYAKNAYLTGSFYANQGDKDKEISMNNEGVSFGNDFRYYYDEDGKGILKIGSGNYYTQVEDDGFKVFEKYHYSKYNLEDGKTFWSDDKDYYELQEDGSYKKISEEPEDFNANNYYMLEEDVQVAFFGETAVVGNTNDSCFKINEDTLQGYSNGEKYFEVSRNSLSYGSYLAASETYTDDKADEARQLAEDASLSKDYLYPDTDNTKLTTIDGSHITTGSISIDKLAIQDFLELSTYEIDSSKSQSNNTSDSPGPQSYLLIGGDNPDSILIEPIGGVQFYHLNDEDQNNDGTLDSYIPISGSCLETLKNGAYSRVAYVSDDKLYINQGTVVSNLEIGDSDLESARYGSWKFVPHEITKTNEDGGTVKYNNLRIKYNGGI